MEDESRLVVTRRWGEQGGGTDRERVVMGIKSQLHKRTKWKNFDMLFNYEEMISIFSVYNIYMLHKAYTTHAS